MSVRATRREVLTLGGAAAAAMAMSPVLEAMAAVPAWKSMAERFNDPNNRKLYKRRAAIIEPVFAQLFARFGRYLNFRVEDVDTELHLWAVAHNLLKIIHHRRRKPRPG